MIRVWNGVISMIRNEEKGIVYYSFENLGGAGGVRHLFSTRFGGVSEGKFASMNLGFTRGDDGEAVEENYRRIASLGFPREKMVFSNQVHEVNVKRVGSADCGQPMKGSVDGLMTDEVGVVLVTFYADCVPLYFYDPVRRAIALSHAGWRGTIDGIGQVTVEAMEREFGSIASDILVGIGPSICGECFEVGEDVAEKFGVSGRTVDLWDVNRRILMEAGVLEKNIELPMVCTKCNPDEFYSHRVMGGDRGSLAAVMVLEDER